MESEKSPYDRLTLATNATVKKMIQKYGVNYPDHEVIIYSNNLIKINRKGREQERTLLITSKALYNLVPKKLHEMQAPNQARGY